MTEQRAGSQRRPDILFVDRLDAADKLAQALSRYGGQHPLVLAIPRGAVPMGALLARRLQGELDVVLVRKLSAPGCPEFAIGAVDESGRMYEAPHAQVWGATPDYLESERRLQEREIHRRRSLYTPGRTMADAKGRIVIVVDDGLATGATMISALHAIREHRPARLVCAVPVASPDSLDQVRPLADEVVCLHAPAGFSAVGQFYQRFPQVDDDEVVAMLRVGTRPGEFP